MKKIIVAKKIVFWSFITGDPITLCFDNTGLSVKKHLVDIRFHKIPKPLDTCVKNLHSFIIKQQGNKNVNYSGVNRLVTFTGMIEMFCRSY